MLIRIISILTGILMCCYIVLAAVFFHDRKEDGVCNDLQIVVKDSLNKHFVTEADVIEQLKRAGLNPIKKSMQAINTDKIEKELMKNEMIAKVEVYKTPSNKVKLAVVQKIPIMRVIGTYGSFYIDNLGTVMPVSYRYTALLPVASGYVEKDFAMNELYKFALFLHGNDFWNSQIEQIYIHSDKEVELIPRVGNHRIVLGAFDGFEEKLANLQLFYDQVIPKMGWNKYSTINLKYKNQIVCTKK